MAEFVKVSVGSESGYLDKLDNNTWTKQLTAPGMPGAYKVSVEIGNSDGNIKTIESANELTVTTKIIDLGIYGKINEKLIRRVVLTLSGCESHVVFKDSTIFVFVITDEDNPAMLKCIEKILLPKIPAHLKLSVQRYLNTWGKLLYDFNTWQDVKDRFATWQEVRDYIPQHPPVEPLKEV